MYGESKMNEHITATCPQCSKPLVIRRNKKTDKEFLGCEQWPDCTYTEPLPAYIEMKRAGAQTLPGIE